MSAPKHWGPFHVSAVLSVSLTVDAESEEQARAFVASALACVEVVPGYANGEQPRDVVATDVSAALDRLIAAARLAATIRDAGDSFNGADTQAARRACAAALAPFGGLS